LHSTIQNFHFALFYLVKILKFSNFSDFRNLEKIYQIFQNHSGKTLWIAIVRV